MSAAGNSFTAAATLSYAGEHHSSVPRYATRTASSHCLNRKSPQPDTFYNGTMLKARLTPIHWIQPSKLDGIRLNTEALPSEHTHTLQSPFLSHVLKKTAHWLPGLNEAPFPPSIAHVAAKTGSYHHQLHHNNIQSQHTTASPHFHYQPELGPSLRRSPGHRQCSLCGLTTAQTLERSW